MSMALGNLNLLSIADRAAGAHDCKERVRTTATHKNFLAVQIVRRFNGIQGKGISDDQ